MRKVKYSSRSKIWVSHRMLSFFSSGYSKSQRAERADFILGYLHGCHHSPSTISFHSWSTIQFGKLQRKHFWSTIDKILSSQSNQNIMSPRLMVNYREACTIVPSDIMSKKIIWIILIFCMKIYCIWIILIFCIKIYCIWITLIFCIKFIVYELLNI